MMIMDMHLKARFVQDIDKLANSGRLPRVDKDEPCNLFQVDVAKPFETVNVDGRFYEVLAQRAFLRTGKNQQGAGIELLGRNHGSHCVEVCVYMGSDDFHPE